MVIDLGEISPASPPQHVPPSAPGVGVGWLRLVLLLATSLALGASSLSAATPMRLVATIGIGIPASVLVDGDEMVVVDGHDNQFEISVYAVAGGVRRWSTPLDGSAVSPGLSLSPTTVMVTMPDTQTGSVLTEAYDRRTGAGLWSVAAYVGMTVPGDGVVMLGTFGGVGGPGGTVVRLLDERTGATRWSQTIPATCQVVYGGESVDVESGLVELCVAPGQLIVRDLATGRVRAERPVDVAPRGTAAAAASPPSIDLIGDLVLLTLPGPSAIVTRAYRVADLTPLWTDVSRDDVGYRACGADICRDGGDTAGRTIVVDARTGHEITSGPLLPVPLPPEALPLFAPVGRALATLVLLTPGELPPPPVPHVTADDVYPVPEASIVHVPPAVDGTTWVARATATGIDPIQRLDGVRADSCLPVSTYVMCAMPAGVLAVWRLPRH